MQPGESALLHPLFHCDIELNDIQKFGGQEPGDDGAIASFCELNHGVNFPLMKKSDVNGDNTNPVYQWLKNEKPGLMGLSRIKVRYVGSDRRYACS